MVIVDDPLEARSDSIPSYASPNPSPARGVYGFVLFICSWFSFVLYLIWAILPTPYLESLHLTYLPAKYWAIAVPLLLPITVAAFIIFVLAHNLIQLHGVFEDTEIVEDDFGGSVGVRCVDLQSFFANIRSLDERKGKRTILVIMSREASRILKLIPFSLLSARRETNSFGRRFRRKTRIIQSIPTKALSVSKINELMRKRLETSWCENRASTLEMDLDSVSARRYLEINANKYPSIVTFQQTKKEENEYGKKELTVKCDYQETRKEYKLSFFFAVSSSPRFSHGEHGILYTLLLQNILLADSSVLKANSSGAKNPAENSLTFRDLPGSDRGFYIYGDSVVDEFVVGSTADIPGGELENVDDEVVIRYGAEDAIEEIDFQLPGQNTNPKDNIIEDEGDEYFDNCGTVDPSIPSSNRLCLACGANFHCQDASLPGFLPAEIFLKLNDYSDQLCRRCYMLKKHKFLLNVNVCTVDYHSMMKHLKLIQESLIILVVDMCDLPGSIYSELPKIIGYQKPMIVVGNKVDLLPPDAHRGFLHHFRQVLHSSLKEAGFVDNFNILHTSLISAKTGYGVEDLITNIFLRFSTRDSLRNHMYLVGCTNAGKSLICCAFRTLFNALLQSDLCKVRAVDLVERAAATPWPGTTISLLKFPVMNPSPHKLEIRRRRLLANQAWRKKEDRMRYNLYRQSGDIKYAMLQSAIGNSFKDREEELQPPALHSVLEDSEVVEKPKRVFDPNSFIFAKGKWCFDTPGTVNSNQILDLFTLEELIAVLPRSMILPRTFILHSGESLLIAGVAQIDVISLPMTAKAAPDKDYPERRSSVLLTVFASDKLPIFTRKTHEMAVFREKYLGSSLLVVPAGDAERIARFPILKGSEMILQSPGSWKGCGDVVLSSVGWVCVTSRRGEVHLQAHTPEGRGLFLRQPALLPFCAELRGSRIGGTAAYKFIYHVILMDTLTACRLHLLASPKMKILSTSVLIILPMIFFSRSVLSIVAQYSALLIGYFLTSSLMNRSNGEFLWNFFENWLNEKLDANEVTVENIFKDVHNSPWKGVTVPESVDKLLEELIEQLIDNYVNSWYKAKVSDDTAFVNEIRYQIRYAIVVLYLRFRKIDLSSIILFEAVPLAVIHCDRVEHLSAVIDKSICSAQLIETQILEAMPDVHFALSSRQNEVDYLRELADHLIELIMDESCIAGHSSDNDSLPWSSHVCRHFLRELFVFSFFLPAMDLIADPDIINRILIFLFNSDALSCPQMSQSSRQVEILHGLTNHSLNDTPNSLLQLKLSDMLRDTGQLVMFRAYLSDIHTPLNELDFLVHAGDAHGRMLNVQNDHVAMSELQYDIWELFVKYIHEGSPDRVDLPLEISYNFNEAVEKRDCMLLDRCLEKAFQIVYKRMQHEYVIPFCQSECFLGNLCGARPVDVVELIASGKHTESTHSLIPAVEPNCSLTQFRNRFWRIVLPTVGSADPSFDHFNNIALNEIEPADDMGQSLSFSSPNYGTTMPNFEPDELLVEQTNLNNSFAIPMYDPERDMNKWNVTIPYVEPRRDPVGGHTVYVYVISVERFDVRDDVEQESLSAAVTPQRWSIIRHYNEFYILESKLVEFHGNAIKTESLPPRRFFNCKSRAHVESRREIFEHFIQLLTKQRALKQSDLLFVFLSTEQKLKDSTQISDLYPWNMVKKVPSKFARERGQNLKPFILSLLAATLVPHSNNLAESNSFCDAILLILNRLFGVVRWPMWIIITIKHLMGCTIDAVVAILFRRFLNKIFVEVNLIRILHFIQESIFRLRSPTETDQEKVVRMELAQRLTLKYLQEQLPTCFIKLIGHKQFYRGMHAIFRVLQYPRLNKQLAYLFVSQNPLVIRPIKMLREKRMMLGIVVSCNVSNDLSLVKGIFWFSLDDLDTVQDIGMRIYDCFQHLPYAFEQVATVFWHRYPNKTAKHVISEDFIEVTIVGDQIRTKKLILKQTGTFLKAVPKWMSRLTNIRVVPTVEESIFDRSKRSLVTYTRNITMLSTCKIHERCVYKPGFQDGVTETIVERGGFVSTSLGKFNSVVERVLMANFKKNMRKAASVYMEKLMKRFGEPTMANHRTSESYLVMQKINRRNFSTQE
ncbi:unnamed protein product [Litomosoides sigmodontis]|uniref:PIG-P domain-containing protein n=1 Tax=Litomosoides sigmodontis TaxID=42156 RepID=A0A3P6UZ38_LITSI|nr:unnamed protein product [Litomosoides sigmodontis]